MDGKMVWYAFRTVFADAGATLIAGLIIGFLGGLFSIPYLLSPQGIFIEGMTIGLLISLYMAYLFQKKYNADTLGLIALLLVATLMGILQSFSTIGGMQTSLTESALQVGATLVVYVIGWYVAKMMNVKIFLLAKGWVTAFMVVGMIGFALILIDVVPKLI